MILSFFWKIVNLLRFLNRSQRNLSQLKFEIQGAISHLKNIVITMELNICIIVPRININELKS